MFKIGDTRRRDRHTPLLPPVLSSFFFLLPSFLPSFFRLLFFLFSCFSLLRLRRPPLVPRGVCRPPVAPAADADPELTWATRDIPPLWVSMVEAGGQCLSLRSRFGGYWAVSRIGVQKAQSAGWCWPAVPPLRGPLGFSKGSS